MSNWFSFRLDNTWLTGSLCISGFGSSKKACPPLLLRVEKSEVGCCVGHAVLWALIGMKKVALGASPPLSSMTPPTFFGLNTWLRFAPSVDKPVFIETSLASFQDSSFPEFGRPLNFRPFHLHKNHAWLYKRRERNLFRPNAVSHATSSCPEFNLSRIYRRDPLEIQISLDCKWPLQYSEVSRRFQSNLVWEEEDEKTKVATLQGLISPFPFLVLCPISMQTRQTANSSISLTPLSH